MNHKAPRGVLVVVCFVAFSIAVNCSSDSNSNKNEGGANGGYTGLDEFTNASGKYGVTGTSKGGTTSSSFTETSVGGGSGAEGGGAGGTQSNGGASSNTTTSSTFIWPNEYDPSGSSLDSTGHHKAGTNCMTSSCHGSSSGSRAFAFGGTIYKADGSSAASHVQIAIVSGETVVTTYSGSNGNFYVPSSSAQSLGWTNARVYLRNSRAPIGWNYWKSGSYCRVTMSDNT
jgi:hypothetical protein